MITRKRVKVQPTQFSREYEIQVNGFTIVSGDIIKIQGEHGRKFKFHSLVTNTLTGAVWIDCFEMQKVTAGAYYSFTLERVKRIPAKRGKRRKKIVN